MTRARLLAITCALDLACGTGDVVHEGEHVDFVFDPELEPCGDVVGHMDRYVEAVAAYLDVSLADRQFTFHWLPFDRFVAETPCGPDRLGCADNTASWSRSAPHDHELAHVVARVLGAGRRPALFSEGLAVALQLPDHPSRDLQSTEGQDVLPYADSSFIPANLYPLAGIFTRFLLDRYGVPAYLAFYVELGGVETRGAVEALFLDHFDEEFAAVVEAFVERGDCMAGAARLKLLECGGPPIEWDGRSLQVRRSLSCDETDVVGPFSDGSARTWVKLEVATDGLHELAVAGAGAWGVTFAACGGCDVPLFMSLTPGERERVWLPAGSYYAQLTGSAAATDSIALQIDRIDPE